MDETKSGNIVSVASNNDELLPENPDRSWSIKSFSSVSGYWMLATLILSLILVVYVIYGSVTNSGVSGNTILSEQEIGVKAVAFINDQLLQGKGNVTLNTITKTDSLYEVVVDFQGQQVPTYFTGDGKYFVGSQIMSTSEKIAADNSSASDSETDSPAKAIPKSDKPVVELFVMSYCPYGTQAEKGILPVADLLKDKIDFKIRFVHYTMHGDKETTENNRQLCIREEQPTKFNSYMNCVLNSKSASEPANLTQCEKTAGISSTMLQTCLTSKAADYYKNDSALSQKYGVQGSPTLIINGVESSAGRSPQSYLTAICAAFTDSSKISECSKTLSTATPSAGFSSDAGSASSDSASCS
jgi:protein-disulfide isomerase